MLDSANLPAPPSPLPQPYQETRTLIISTLTTVATIIGSGILALPVSLYNISVPVFLLIFTLTWVSQNAVVYITIELLQHSRSNLLPTPPSHTYNSTSDPLPSPAPKVSLFSIARHFLPSSFFRYVFYFITYVCFIAILVSYGLAGPQAIYQFVNRATLSEPPSSLVISYCIIGTIAVVFFVDFLLPVFGSFTVVKGMLFIAVVLIVAALPKAARPFSLYSLFSHFDGIQNGASSLLIGIVALGGLANTLPVTFNLLPTNITNAQLRRYRSSVVIGLLICYLLNIGWVLALLQVVPRDAPDGEPSLTAAFQQGQISTVPLIAVLERHQDITGSVLTVVEMIIELFIIISTGVSFFVMAAGLKNFLDGVADSVFLEQAVSVPLWVTVGLMQMALYVVSFGTVLLIIVGNPQGFISIMTHFTSVSFVTQGGLFLFWMLHKARRDAVSENRQITMEMEKGTVVGWNACSLPLLIFAGAIGIFGPAVGINIG